MVTDRPDSGLYPTDRLQVAAAAARDAGLAALLLTPGPDLRYLTGYDAYSLYTPQLVIVALDPHRDQPSSVTGETDSRIYDRRVRSVRDALVAAGVPAQRIHTGPLGERQVLCHQATAECQELNRRVEVLLGTPRVSAELR